MVKMNNLFKSTVALLAVGLLSSAAFCEQAKAAPITGTIDFGGVVSFDTLSLATATRVMTWNSSFVLQDTGNFATFAPAGTSVTMAAPWIFTPSTATPSLWSVGGFKFDLTSSTVVSHTTNFLNITGVGTISGNGFTPTPGVWSFTASSASGTGQSTFGFQANTSAVPEPSTFALMLGGLGSLLGAQRLLRRRS
jgi:hypothetical protein